MTETETQQGREIILGPKVDLHDGVHGALVTDPPADVRYSVRQAKHLFQFSDRGVKSPHEHFHFGECVDFGSGSELVHSARWPVINRGAWVTDMDDFGYPVLVGRALVNPDVRSRLRGDVDARIGMRRRGRNMLAMYAHPSCKAVIFRTQQGIDLAGHHLANLQVGALAETFLQKALVLYPAQRTSSREKVDRKWAGDTPLRVVFCGRDYETKNGLLALRIFRRLAATMPDVSFTYIGEVPPECDPRVLGPGIEILGTLQRREVLDAFERGHILFHPSKFESVGIVLLEAAAAGMAIVAATGGEMAHMSELFDADRAVLLNRDTVAPGDEEKWFYDELRQLVSSPLAAASMARRNYMVSVAGKFSLTHRNATLSAIYESAIANPAEPATVSQLWDAGDGAIGTLESRAVLGDQVEYLHKIGITKQHVNVLG